MELGIEACLHEAKAKQNLSHEETFLKLEEVLNALMESKLFVLFIFHNLDCASFYSIENLSAISRLAKLPHVSFIASIDSISFPRLISKQCHSNFAFYYLSLHTHAPYRSSLQYLNFFYAINQKNKNLSGTRGIL